MSIIGAEARANRPPQPEDFLKDVPLDLFGGLCSEMDSGDLPQGASPFCQDVDFLLGEVFSRNGLTALFPGQLPAGVQVNYLKTYTLPTGNKQLLVLDSLGNLYFEDTSFAPGILNRIGLGIGLYPPIPPNTFAHSVTFLGREYIAFHNHTAGVFPPMQWDGMNLDRVTQDGPGAPPVVAGVESTIGVTSITQPASVSLNAGALLWSDAAGSTNHGNIITVYYKQVSAGAADPGVVIGANVWLQGLPSFGAANPNGLYPIVSVQTVIGENHGGGSNVPWYTFSVVAPVTTYGQTFLTGGTYQLTLATVTLATPTSQTQPGGQLAITGGTVASWDLSWTVESILRTCAATITQTGLAGAVATYAYTLQTNPLTNALYAQPAVGQLLTVVNSDNGGGIFNVVNAPIVSVTPVGGGGTLTINLNSGAVATLADSGTLTVQGTEFTIDPGDIIPAPVNPIFGNSTGGNAAVAGLLPAGTYQCVQMFQTRNGALTRPSPPAKFTLNGTESAISVSSIAIGPNVYVPPPSGGFYNIFQSQSNVVARVLAFTGPNGDFFYWLAIPVVTTVGGVTTTSSATVVNDNATISVTLSFTIDALLAGAEIDQPGGDQFALDVLGPVMGFDEYSSRLVAWGELEAIQNFVNMGFDGGLSNGATGYPATTRGLPLGWQGNLPSPTLGAGYGIYGSVNAVPASWPVGGMYVIEGDGATPIVGMIQQSAATDWEGEPILLPNTTYSVRVMIAQYGATQGNAVVELYSPTQGSLGTFTVAVGFLSSGKLAYVDGVLGTTGAKVPGDLQLRIYASGTLNAGALIFFDEAAVYPANQPYRTAEARLSYAENPEGFDGVTGLLGVSDFGSGMVTAVGKLRTTLYLFGDPGFAETSDDRISEPADWEIDLISSAVGTPSVDGVATGEEWIVFADRKGAYITSGNEPLKISQEIEPTWEQMSQSTAVQGANTLWTVNDVAHRRILFGLPINAGTTPNVVLMMSYVDLNSSWEVAEQKPLHLSYMGRMVSWDMSRKWCPWNITASCAAICRTQDQRDWIYFGNGSGTGKIYKLDPFQSVPQDDGLAINSIYTTFFFVNRDMEQMLQMGMHRKVYDYMVAYVLGSGALGVSVQSDTLNSPRVKNLASRMLTALPGNEREWQVNFTGERAAFTFQVATVGSWFRLSKMTVRMRQDPWMPIRGIG